MRGRFAPTPSGRMHLGNIFAMFAAWLSARSDPHGTIALRIEDIDTPRVVPDADRWIMDDLTWLGLDWDGDPVYQSRRGDIYATAFETLRKLPLEAVTSDFPLVYPCFCSRADIKAASAPQEGDGSTRYPGTCRRAYAVDPRGASLRIRRGDRHAWRIAMPDSDFGAVNVADRVFGGQRFELSRDVGDSVIRRSDGLFSYQLAVVVDDLLMGVDDIVRGRDLLRSAALQIWIRRRLVDAGFAGFQTMSGDPVSFATLAPSALYPAYAHLPLVDDGARHRLAKRAHSFDVGRLREEGVRPEQIIGYCAWMLGLREPGQRHPEAITARVALSLFSWDRVSSDTHDHVIVDPSRLRDLR